MAALGNEYSYHIWCSLKWFSEENTLIGPGPVLPFRARCCRSSWMFTEGYQATLSMAFTRPQKSALNWGQGLSAPGSHRSPDRTCFISPLLSLGHSQHLPVTYALALLGTIFFCCSSAAQGPRVTLGPGQVVTGADVASWSESPETPQPCARGDCPPLRWGLSLLSREEDIG